MPTKKQNTGLILVALMIFAALVFLGIRLLSRSEDVYQQSVTAAEKAMANKLSLPAGYTILRDGYAQAFSFFMLAIGVLLMVFLLPRLQNLSIGPMGVTLALREVQQNLEAVIKQNNAIQAESTGIGGGKPKPQAALVAASEAEPDHLNDPQKGKWGGKPEIDFRKMSAEVTPTAYPGFYRVLLVVSSTNRTLPLNGVVKFHLHNTFQNPNPVIAVHNGKAILDLPAVYGAFTVGAETDDGDVQLELDLATLTDVPKKFKEK